MYTVRYGYLTFAVGCYCLQFWSTWRDCSHIRNCNKSGSVRMV